MAAPRFIVGWFAASILAFSLPGWADEGCPKNHFILEEPICSPTSVSPLKGPRLLHTATRLADGRVLVVGGQSMVYSAEDSRLASVEIFDPASGRWTSAAPLHQARAGHAAALLSDGRVAVVGGEAPDSRPWPADGRGPYPIGGSSEIYDPAEDRWTVLPTGAPATTRLGHTLTALSQGRMLIAGGVDSARRMFGFDIVDAASGMDVMVQGAGERWGHSASLLPDGRVLLSGGWVGGNPDPVVTASALRVDPARAATELAATAAFPRSAHRATTLADGRVLVTGGGYFGDRVVQLVPTAEIYDPELDAWSNAANLSVARFTHTATLLADGSVLVAGGMAWGGGGYMPTASTEIVAGDVAVQGVPLSVARSDHTATLLLDGTVLVVGGFALVDYANARGEQDQDFFAIDSVERIRP